MSPLHRLTGYWRNVFRRARVERDLDEELHAYVDLIASEKVAKGLPEDEARREAQLELGGFEQVKEEVRDIRLGSLFDTVVRDLRIAARSLVRNRAFTAAAVLALALGIGATTAILSVVNAILLRPLPYAEPERLVVLLHRGRNPVSVANYLDWRREGRAFEAMGAAEFWTPNLTGTGTPENVFALRVTPSLLPLLGVPPQLGRLFLPEEGEVGRDTSVILSHGFWLRQFGGDPSALGRSIVLNGRAHTIVGIMPPEFRFAPFWATRAEFWVPLAFGERASQRSGNSLRLFARLSSGATLEQARAEMAGITARLEQQFPGTNRNLVVDTLTETVVGDIRRPLLVLLAAVGGVLLIACANVAHMLLARAAARQREIAVRTALGASRSRLFRQLLTESLLLAAIGGAAGVGLASAGVRALVAAGPSAIPRLETIGIDARVLIFAAVVSLVTGLLFGVVPAAQASRLDVSGSLKEGERGSTEGPGRARARRVLVASECALALVLLAGSGLMIRTFVAMQRIDPGFEPRNVLTAVVSVAGSTEAQAGRREAFFREVIENVQALPGIESAAAINHLPLAGDYWTWPYWIEGRPPMRPGEVLSAVYRVVWPGYFRTMRLPLVAGRDFTDRDTLSAPGVVLVNERLAAEQWPGESAIGKRLSMSNRVPEWRTVIGVVRNAAQEDWIAPPRPELYLPYLQNRGYLENPASHMAYLTLVVRTRDGASPPASAVKAAVWTINRNVPVSQVQTMEEAIGDATGESRFYVLLLSAFGASALLLAAVGIYGVMSYAVSRRTHEIGLRMALGADRRQVLVEVIGQGLRVAAAGAAVGLVAALMLTELMATLLYGVDARDPVTFLAVAGVLITVAILASYLPARHATRIDPIVALRHD